MDVKCVPDTALEATAAATANPQMVQKFQKCVICTISITLKLWIW